MHDPEGARQFATTQWSVVGAARLDQASQSRARDALERLCRAYWYPLYAFVRSRGFGADDAQDLTQAFFARIIEKGGFVTADQRQGRFRSYLLGAMKHFLANEWHRARAQKRGGGVPLVDWEAIDPESRHARQPEPAVSPELLYDREWALQTVSSALEVLREEMQRAGKGELFTALESGLTGKEDLPRTEIAAKLGMNEGAVKVALHRLRRRYGQLLRATISQTVDNGADLEDEMRYLLSVLRTL